MEVVLIESVFGLGRPGDQVKVKSGYARNYLFPHAKAVPVSADVMRNLGKLKERADEEERAMISSMEELRAKLAGTVVEITARATEEGHLFGSVTDKDIQSVLARDGWSLPPRSVRLEGHVKEAGDTTVEVHLYGEISADIQVRVVPVDGDGNPIDLTAARKPAANDDESEAGADAGDESGVAPASDAV
jgi:large subunit ribosomal protein L9